MTLAIIKGVLIFTTLLFGAPMFIQLIRGQTITAIQNILWEASISAFITLQWLLP